MLQEIYGIFPKIRKIVHASMSSMPWLRLNVFIYLNVIQKKIYNLLEYVGSL